MKTKALKHMGRRSIFAPSRFLASRLPKIWLAPIGVVLIGLLADQSGAQQPIQINVQQPVIRHFGVNTVVSVPDGGTMSLGGMRRSAEGSLQVGVPGMGNVPYAGRLFQNRSLGISRSASHASVSVHVISLKELERQIMQEADQRQAQRQAQRQGTDLSGSPAMQQKSDFITRNLGRR